MSKGPTAAEYGDRISNDLYRDFLAAWKETGINVEPVCVGMRSTPVGFDFVNVKFGDFICAEVGLDAYSRKQIAFIVGKKCGGKSRSVHVNTLQEAALEAADAYRAEEERRRGVGDKIHDAITLARKLEEEIAADFPKMDIDRDKMQREKTVNGLYMSEADYDPLYVRVHKRHRVVSIYRLHEGLYAIFDREPSLDVSDGPNCVGVFRREAPYVQSIAWAHPLGFKKKVAAVLREMEAEKK